MVCINLWMSITHFVYYAMNYNFVYMLLFAKCTICSKFVKHALKLVGGAIGGWGHCNGWNRRH